ncbi:hypothetical protein Tco_0435237 [Tanacetum coccineum]
MIQPEPEGSTQGYPLVSVEVLSHGLSDAMHNPPQPLKVDPHGLEDTPNQNTGRMTKPIRSQRRFHRLLLIWFNTMILRDGGEGLEFKVPRWPRASRWRKRRYAWLMISLKLARSHSRQAEEQAQDLKSIITTSNHKLKIEVKRAQD